MVVGLGVQVSQPSCALSQRDDSRQVAFFPVVCFLIYSMSCEWTLFSIFTSSHILTGTRQSGQPRPTDRCPRDPHNPGDLVTGLLGPLLPPSPESPLLDFQELC